MKKEILEGNKLIENFMGDKWDLSDNYIWQNHGAYNESWDRLMPVYKKLMDELDEKKKKIKSNKGCSLVSKQALLMHIDDCLSDIRCEIWGVRIIDTFNGIVETIKQYNEDFKSI